jgi:hypothetical protein
VKVYDFGLVADVGRVEIFDDCDYFEVVAVVVVVDGDGDCGDAVVDL